MSFRCAGRNRRMVGKIDAADSGVVDDLVIERSQFLGIMFESAHRGRPGG